MSPAVSLLVSSGIISLLAPSRPVPSGRQCSAAGAGPVRLLVLGAAELGHRAAAAAADLVTSLTQDGVAAGPVVLRTEIINRVWTETEEAGDGQRFGTEPNEKIAQPNRR